MSKMHAVAAGSTSGVQEEGLALLIAIQDLVEFPVREEHSPAEEDMRSLPSELFKALEKGVVYAPSPKLRDQLVIVDPLQLAVCCNGSLDLPGRNDLLVRNGLLICPKESELQVDSSDLENAQLDVGDSVDNGVYNGGH